MPLATRDAYEQLLNELQEMVYGIDHGFRVTFMNRCARKAWRREGHDVVGQPLHHVFPNLPEAFVIFLRRALQAPGRSQTEVFSENARAWMDVVTLPHEEGLMVYVRRQDQTPPNLAVTAQHDTLTGCLMREAFLKAVQNAPRPAVLAILDLNRLKAINELHGHAGGDAYIRNFSRSLLDTFPSGALVCRWGGDEFVILLPGDDLSEMEALLEQLRQTTAALIADALSLPNMPAFQFGVARFPPEETPFEQAFAVADEGLHRAKQVQRRVASGEPDAPAIAEFSRFLATLAAPESVAQASMMRLLDLLDFDVATYSAWGQGGDVALDFVSRSGAAVAEFLNLTPMDGRVERSDLTQRLLQVRRPLYATHYPGEPDASPELVEAGLKSVVVTPVLRGEEVVGNLALLTLHRWRTITPQVRQLLELAALRLGHALELRWVIERVRSTLEAGLLGLGVALEARDLETHGHTQRVATLVMQLGEELGLSDEERAMLRDGAHLHDIGKLMIPDAILLKPGALTPEEWTLMQSHAVKGRELAARIPQLAPEVLDIIAHHHEWWDGSGYPDGLKGEEIPLLAQVFAVCDVFDALVNDRPYKVAWSVESALEEIERLAGRQFCPGTVQGFLSMMRRVSLHSRGTPH